MSDKGWIGVDLDGTLAYYDIWRGGAIGAPIPAMLARVRQWLADGEDVRIVTARVAIVPRTDGERGFAVNAQGQAADQLFAIQQVDAIKRWCVEHLGQALPVTAAKDFHMRELWDDRAVQLATNTGETIVEIADRQFQKAQARIRDLEASQARLTRALGADPDAAAAIL